MRLVLDASAAIEVAMSRGKAAKFAQVLEEADEVLAPDLFVPEVVNTLWKYHQFEDLSQSACERALSHALSLVDAFVPCSDLYREAFLLARTARRSAYDMFYLALARREDAALLTTDKALGKEAEGQGVIVL